MLVGIVQQGTATTCWNNPAAEHLLCHALLDARVTGATLKRLLLLQANWLKSVGVRKGDAVAIYMPMVRFTAPAAQPCINDAFPIEGQSETCTQTTLKPYSIIIITRFACREARCVCRQAAVKAAKFLPLVGLARSKQDPINRGHGWAQHIWPAVYMPPCSTCNGPGCHMCQGGVSIHLMRIAQQGRGSADCAACAVTGV
jgi:hypothetical protein